MGELGHWPRSLGRLAPRDLYLLAGLAWMLTRLFVLLHQGSWPWMNFFVVETAQGMLAGSWDEAVRPPLPSLLALPLLLAGAGDLATILTLYLLGSLLEFCAFLLFLRHLFPGRMLEQGLALTLLLVLPMSHSIHHWRNVPVILATSGTLLIAAHWLRAHRTGLADIWSPRSVGWALGAVLLGAWSRTETLTFVVGLVLLGLVSFRSRIGPLVGLYLVACLIAVVGSLGFVRAAGADLAVASRYQVHTFLDSTPASWLSSGCRNYPTEDCREQEGWTYFGPEDRQVGLTAIIARHPLTALAKTWRSGLDNLWELFGRNVSTYPGTAWFLLALLLLRPGLRRALRAVPLPAWMVAGAALGVSLLPPLAWAPPHPQYHLHSLAAVVVVVVPVLAALVRGGQSSLLVNAFYAANVVLSAYRYTRYPGY